MELAPPAQRDLPRAQASSPAAAPPAVKESKKLEQVSEFATAKPSPEAWYAEIEKLRAAGRMQEADRELERLKKAYPGWLEQHLEEQKKP